MSRPRLIVCSGLELPKADPLRKGRHVVPLDTLDEEGNVNLLIENVTRAFRRAMPPRVVDLLEIAAYVFAADCSASRDGAWKNDEAEEPWGRDFHFAVPVRDPSFWQREEVQSTLIGALRFMSSDTFAFTFHRLRKDRPLQPYLELAHAEDAPFQGAERVVMFSGGLDSLAGAVETAARGQPLVAVSHRPAPHVSALQTGLMQQLQALFSGPIRHIPVWVNKQGLDSEATQRTRAFLFSALGVAVASVLNAGGVRFYENGVTSLNWPVTQEVLQSRATRSTHPLTLHRLQEFYRLLTERPEFAIDNPFVFDTKAEVVSRIASAGVPQLIGLSASCIHTRDQTSRGRHCGVCRQCLDRRIAILAADQETSEQTGGYRSDVFTGPRREGYDHNIAVDYARQATDLDQMDVAGVWARYSQELARAVRCYEHQAEVARRFIDLHKRHAATVCAVIDAQLKAHTSALRAGRLDRTCLLSIIGLREHLEGPPKEQELPLGLPAQGDVFRLDGQNWTVSFSGVTKSFRDAKGMRYIAFLLEHQGEEFHVLELAQQVDGTPLPNLAYSQMTEEQLESEGTPLASHTSQREIIDGKYQADVEQKVKRLQESRDIAEAMGDDEAVAAIQNEIEAHLTPVAGAIGRGGQRREFMDEGEKARQRISKAIHAALRVMEDRLPGLHAHLKSFLLPLGHTVGYGPTPPARWSF
jgi:hypothetical protein